LVLVAPNPVFSAGDSPAAGGEKIASPEGTPPAESETGRGEGFQPEAEATKGPEIPSTFGPLVTDTAIPIEKGKFAVQPTFSFSHVTDEFSPHWGRTSTDGDGQSFGMDWKFSYGLIENMEVFVVLPYVHNWATEGGTSADSGGLGDINLTLKYRLVEETASLPTVTALFATDFPTGKFKNLNANDLDTDAIGGGAYVFTAGFNVSKYIAPFVVYANLWYSMQTAYKDDEGHQYPGDFVTVNLAAEYPITQKWVGLLELTSHWGGGRLFGPDTNVPHDALLSVVPAIEYMATEHFSLALGLNVDLIGQNTDATLGPLFSMVYAF
jgi:hypothetical protein